MILYVFVHFYIDIFVCCNNMYGILLLSGTVSRDSVQAPGREGVGDDALHMSIFGYNLFLH